MQKLLAVITLLILIFTCREIDTTDSAIAQVESTSGKVEMPEKSGENCFDLFKADAVGHAWENAYLLALVCHYNYHDKLDVTAFEDFPQFERKYRELFSSWGIDTFEFIQTSGRAFDTELIVMSKREGDFVIVAFRGSERIGGPVSAVNDNILTDFVMNELNFPSINAPSQCV